MTDEIRLIRLPEVREMTGLSRTRIYELERLGRFPRRRKLSERACAWIEGEVQDWIRSRPVAGNGEAA